MILHHPQIEQKSTYRMGDFLKFSDSDFIVNAYYEILGRAPDPEGLAEFLGAYRAGTLAKIEILGRLRYSGEGRAKGVSVRGLLFRFIICAAYRAPIVRVLWPLLGIGISRLTSRPSVIEARLDQAGAVSPVVSASALAAEPSGASATRIQVYEMLHHARSALLREMPSGTKRLLSTGCNGRWYFDWIERCYGRVQEHIGLEFYLPQPEGLPQNVKWIANTASDMSEVPSETCDMVFSGQNLEHFVARRSSRLFGRGRPRTAARWLYCGG